MQNIRRLLHKKAEMSKVPLWLVEKDYALSYLLAGIFCVSGLREELVLKGGTALKKIYFKDYRFSEDLDFSTIELGPFEELDALMVEAIRSTETMLQNYGNFQLRIERLVLREPHPADQNAFTVRIRFPYHRTHLCRLKIEITIDEPVLLVPEERLILHDFYEVFDVRIKAYALAEIVAEKLRALLQSHARLQLRGWGGSRICRDYYDLWYIMNKIDLVKNDLPLLVKEKCRARYVVFKSPSDFFMDELVDIARIEWQKQLSPFVKPIPDVHQVLSELRKSVHKFWD